MKISTNKLKMARQIRFFMGLLLLLIIGLEGTAFASNTIPIGVMAPAKLVDGQAILHATELAVQQINTAGGVDGKTLKLYEFDDGASGPTAVRALKKAVEQDHVKAMVGIFISEVALAVEPWAARLHVPLIVTGSLTTKLTQKIHSDYSHYKYIFQAEVNSKFIADSVCDSLKDLLADKRNLHKTVILSEDAAFTIPLDEEYAQCLPKNGFKIVDKIKFARNTRDFTPIFNRIKRDGARVAVMAIGLNGVRPVVQWKQQQAPFLLAGQDAEATSPGFWKATNGAASGVLEHSFGANGAAVTDKAQAFYSAYDERFGAPPADLAYPAYDGVYILKNAIERAGSTTPDALVKALEQVNMNGVTGPISFYGRNSEYTHGKKYQKGVMFQWQNGKQIVVWPRQLAQGKIETPAFVDASNR